MNDLGAVLDQTLGATALTNVLLGWMAFELRRAFPYIRALCDHFKLKVKPARAHTEPPHD